MISIITPSFNQGRYIERTLQSVLSQNISELEYIVMDGGSTDETLPILKRYSAELRFFSERDRGQTHAVNKALTLSSGEIIGWLNSDDVYYPDAIKKILEIFTQYPDIDIVYGKANHIDQQDQIVESYPTEIWDKERLKETCFISQPAVFFRRGVIERVGLLNENLNFCMDYEYWLRLAALGAKFFYFPEVLSGSRLYPETKTLSAPDQAILETILMLQKQFNIIPVNWLITYAIVMVKSKTAYRMPEWRYVLAVVAMSIISAFRWNGFWQGLKSCLTLPQVFKIRFQR